jgi:tetratricopeptide (TPR) repeat protein
MLFAQGDLQGALRSYQQALRINPRYADALSALGWTNQALGKDDQAIAYYKQAIRIQPGDYFPYENLGQLYDDRGLIKEEIKLALVRAIPKDFQSYSSLAELYEKLGRDQEAIDVYKDAINALPKEVYAYIFLAQLYEKQTEYAEAVELIERVSRLDAYKIADAYDHLQFIYLLLRETDVDAYKQAVRLAPNNAANHMVLGMLYVKVGDRKSATQEGALLQSLDQDMAFFFSYILLHCEGRRCTKQ